MSTQEMTVAAAENVARSDPGFICITSPPIAFSELFPWFVMLVFALLVIPLGILSVWHSRKRTSQWPLATKLLLLVALWVLVQGLTLFARNAIYSFFTISIVGEGSVLVPMLSMNLGQSLLPISISLSISLLAFLFLAISALLRPCNQAIGKRVHAHVPAGRAGIALDQAQDGGIQKKG